MTTPGRNDPCWCNSGRKYKRCHAASDAATAPSVGASTGVGALLAARRQPTVRPGHQSPPRPVPDAIVRPPYVATDGVPMERASGAPRSADVIARMRTACREARRILLETAARADVGVTTDALDAYAHEATIAIGGYPSPYGYHGYPKSICTSINEVICHGIPDDRPLADGDVLNIDVTIYLDGVHGDTSMMVPVGDVSDEDAALCNATHDALVAGIRAVRPHGSIRAVGQAIEASVAPHGYGVVRAFVGHGIGEAFHTDPIVHHYDNPGTDHILLPGMTFTIEPMINAGTWKHRMWDDDWTAVTADLRPSAQHEHTVLVTDDGVEVLTLADGEPSPI